MSISIVLRKTIYIDGKSGEVNLTSMLGRKPHVVDPLFKEFFESNGLQYRTSHLAYDIYTINNISSVRDLPQIGQWEVNSLCAALSALSQNGLLDIPKGADEIEVVFGRVSFEGVQFVLLVEHEFKRGSDQIHCHARPLGEWKNDKSTLLKRRK